MYINESLFGDGSNWREVCVYIREGRQKSYKSIKKCLAGVPARWSHPGRVGGLYTRRLLHKG